jgi:GntR family transcriptional regulator / MocR family aminotransferase
VARVELHVSLGGPGDPDTRVARIYRALREAVVDGRLAAGDRVPATRDLAHQLGVARGTVTAAYDRLTAEGFLESRPGSGTYVADVAPGDGDPGRRRARPGAVRPLPLWELRRSRLEDATYGGRGSLRLQREIARFLGLSRSVVCAPDDVVVTVGAQQAVDLVARVLVAPRSVVAMEDPGYFAVRRLFGTHRAVVRGVPVDDEGLVVDALPADARLVYVTPSHQFPTGVPMSMPRRVALLRWAVRHDAVVVEDDYDSEYRYAQQPVEPLQSLDRDGRVVYVGTFSKSLLPALRTGFLVPPRSLLPALREAKQVTSWEGDLTTQGALAEFLAEGHHAAHVRRATRVYRERRDRVLDGLAGLDDVLEVIPSVAGLHVAARFRDAGADDRAVVRRAARRGVRVEPLSHHHRDQPPRPGLVIGFSGIDVEAVPDAMTRLAAAVRD